MSKVFDQVSSSLLLVLQSPPSIHALSVKLGTIILERGAFQASQNGRAALATSSLFHHKHFTVRVQRRLEPDIASFSTDVTT